MKELPIKWIYRFTVLLLLFLCIFIFMKLAPLWVPIVSIAKTVLIPIMIAMFITYLLHPLIEKLHEQRIPRSVAILIIYLLFFGGIGIAIYRGIPIVINQLKELADSLPIFIDTYRSMFENIQQKTSQLPNGINERVEEAFIKIEEWLDYLFIKILSILKSVINSFVLIAMIPFLVFYMLKDYDIMMKAIWYVTPRRYRKSGRLFFKDVDESLGNYIRGQLLVCLLIGIFATLSLWGINMEFPLLLGIIIGLTDIIPYFGPIIGAIPAVIIAATISTKMVVLVISLILILQFIEGNILSPLIVGRSLHMHPIMIMVALLIGGEVGGVVGLLIAVPILVIFKVIIIHSKAHFIKH